VDWEAWLQDLGLEVVWMELAASDPGYSRPRQGRLYINRRYWRGRSAAELRRFIVHEAGHALTGSAYYAGNEPEGSTRRQLEARATRAGLGAYISDEAVLAAIDDDCTEVWQFAAAWQVDEPTAAARLRLWQGG
jgi:hypothetical protein